MRFRAMTSWLIGSIVTAAWALASAAAAQTRMFDIPSQAMVAAIPEFGRQAGLQIIAPAGELAGRRSVAIKGQLDARVALRLLLQGTNLEIASDRGGVIALRRRRDPATGAVPKAAAPSPSASNRSVGRARRPRLTRPETASLDEVVVTARRREERLQDVPISVTAFSGEQLVQRGVRVLDDLQNIAPGLKIEPQNNKGSTPQLVIRGQRMYGVLSAQDPPTALYFADAAVAPIQGSNSALYDLASVQVLKGPQGTLFGRNTTGGAVVITPMRPSQTKAASLTLRGGAYHAFGAQGFVNAPLTDELALRFAGYYAEHGGYDTYVSTGNFGQKTNKDRVTDLRLSVAWRPRALENDLVAYYAKIVSSAVPATVVAVNPNSVAALYDGTGDFAAFPNVLEEVWDGRGDPRDVYSRHPQYDHTEVFGGVNTTTFDVAGSWRIKNIAAYRRVSNEALLNITGVDIPLLISFQNAHATSFTEELQVLGSSIGGRVDLVAGAYYSRLKSWDNQASVNNYATPMFGLAPFYTYTDNRSYAVYGQATARLTQKLGLTAGGRVTRDRRHINYMHRTFDYFPGLGVPFAPRCAVISDAGELLPLSACELARQVSYTRATYTLSLEYHLTDAIFLYATQRTGYRSGGFNQRAYTAAQRLPFLPETNLDREVGIKSKFRLGDWAVLLNADVYRDDLKNLQKSTSLLVDGASASSTFNVAAGVVEGVDLELQVRPNAAVSLGANYAYADTRYTSYGLLVRGELTDFSDRRFAGIPKHHVSAYASVRLPVPEDYGMLTLSADWSYQSGVFINELYQRKDHFAVRYTPAQLALLPEGSRPHRQRAYHLLNLRASLREPWRRPVEITVFARNVTNEAPEIANTTQYAGVGVSAVTIGPPRTWGVEVTYGF